MQTSRRKFLSLVTSFAALLAMPKMAEAQPSHRIYDVEVLVDAKAYIDDPRQKWDIETGWERRRGGMRNLRKGEIFRLVYAVPGEHQGQRVPFFNWQKDEWDWDMIFGVAAEDGKTFPCGCPDTACIQGGLDSDWYDNIHEALEGAAIYRIMESHGSEWLEELTEALPAYRDLARSA